MTLASATEDALSRAQKLEEETTKGVEVSEKFEEHVRNINKKIQTLEGQFDMTSEHLFEASIKLEQREKAFNNIEGDVGSFARRALLLEEEVEKSDIRLAKAVANLGKFSYRADKAVKIKHTLEETNGSIEEEIDKLEIQLKDVKFTQAESERKYDDIARKLATKEEEMERSLERCTNGENKIINLEEELRTVGQNLQLLEVNEEKAFQREENFQLQIMDLMDRLKRAELGEENSLMNIQRLNIRIDQTEEDLLGEKLKIRVISDSLDKTFSEMLG